MIAQALSASSTLLQHSPPPMDPSVPTDPSSPDAVTFSAAPAPRRKRLLWLGKEQYDFWDDGKPQQTGISSAAGPPPLNITSETRLTHKTRPAALAVPPQLFEDTKTPVVVPSSLAPAWTPGTLVGGFVRQTSVLDAAAELILPSPTKTLSSSVPATPSSRPGGTSHPTIAIGWCMRL
jgi:hypothetical protein